MFSSLQQSTSGDADVVGVGYVYRAGIAVQDLAAVYGDPGATDDFQQSLAIVFFILMTFELLKRCSAQNTVCTVYKLNASAARGTVIGIVVKAVAADHDILRVFYQEVSVESVVDRVSRDGDSPDCDEVDVVFLCADQVSRDGEHAHFVIRLGRVADHQYIRAARRRFCLDGVARYGAFADCRGPIAGVDPDVCGLVRIFVVVVFDVVAGDL